MGWFKRKPELVDEVFRDLAEMFLDYPKQPTPGSELLDEARMDFSVDSLRLVDAHLEQMRLRRFTDDEEFLLVLRCGAYVGDAIRTNAQHAVWHWLDFDEAVRIAPKLNDLGRDLGSAAVLWQAPATMCFPIAKVVKNLFNGSEDSVHCFAQVMLARLGAPG